MTSSDGLGGGSSAAGSTNASQFSSNTSVTGTSAPSDTSLAGAITESTTSSHTNTLLPVTTPTDAPTTTRVSKGQADSKALPLVAGGPAIGL
ncbi:MAG: hypothetical protein GOMPHAMPRED_002872 [Gomphillus americanus]|uniref:Uncharacterized protein n=1 Tax=Gomphillus americanus TaxID=1940652 RepID=A0A8H3EKE0_9LECA|nr:MAG: hypothetical protein GOMPHAMPRED_002872 [Gomphillus americanus]